MPYQPELVVWFHTEDRKVKPAVMVQMMLEAELPIDAVVCYNDQIAVEVIRMLERIGKKSAGRSVCDRIRRFDDRKNRSGGTDHGFPSTGKTRGDGSRIIAGTASRHSTGRVKSPPPDRTGVSDPEVVYGSKMTEK